MMIRKIIRCYISRSVPIVDVEPYLTNQDSASHCKSVVNALKNFGCVIIKDPRVQPK